MTATLIERLDRVLFDPCHAQRSTCAQIAADFGLSAEGVEAALLSDAPSLGFLRRICEKHELSADYLLGLTDWPHRAPERSRSSRQRDEPAPSLRAANVICRCIDLVGSSCRRARFSTMGAFLDSLTGHVEAVASDEAIKRAPVMGDLMFRVVLLDIEAFVRERWDIEMADIRRACAHRVPQIMDLLAIQSWTHEGSI